MNKKKILAILLSLTMLGSIIGVPVYADGADEETTEIVETVEAEDAEETSQSYEQYEDETVNTEDGAESNSAEVSLMAAGTPNYIYTAEDLNNVRNDLSGVYYLQNDIDLSSYSEWTPLGTGTDTGQYFSGIFDGQGHTISGLTMSGNGYTYSGLFGVSRGIIKNVNVSVTIKDAATAGGLVGYLYYSGTVENCSLSGSVEGNGDIGGLIGKAESSDNDILIRNCYSMANATNTSSNEDDGCGGLVGEIYGRWNTVKVICSYAAGKVTKTGTTGVGGIVGKTSTYNGNYTINSSYYCTDTTEQSDTTRGFGIDEDKMKMQGTYANWDFDNIWDINSSINNGYPYLKLTGEYNTFELDGSGTSRDPYIITSEAELAAVARGEITNNFTSCYELGDDITLTSDYWTPIGGNGMPIFSGTFDGAGHTIYNVNICALGYQDEGLFGKVTGKVENLSVSANIVNANTAGGITGILQNGSIENCCLTGNVSGKNDVGGLVGYVLADGQDTSISNCYSNTITANSSLNEGDGCGGLIGDIYGRFNTAKVIYSYATGRVTKAGTTGIGGIIGYSHTYNGSVTIENSYFDNYNGSSTDKGTYVTTEDMKKQSTYSGWDFDTVWAISSSINSGYPYLHAIIPIDKPTTTPTPTTKPTPTPDTPTPPVTDGAAVMVSSGATSPGGTVNVTVGLSGNKGFANLGVQVGYDANALTLTSVTNNPSVGAVYIPAQQITANPYNMGWDSTGNIAFNGTLATLTFNVKENAPEGKYPITVSYYTGKNGDYTDGTDVNYDENFNSLKLNYVNGAVTVSSHTPGDINGDGKVNNQDGTFLLRHLAGWNVNVDDSALDINGDGKINNQDGTVLLRYLAGWQVNIH